MYKFFLFLALSVLFVSCSKEERVIEDTPSYGRDIVPPVGFEINMISDLEPFGRPISFQFFGEQTGYTLYSTDIGGFANVRKTIDRGEEWRSTGVRNRVFPSGMAFADENFGVVTGYQLDCPSGSPCKRSAVILRTENGATDWELITIEELEGELLYPKFDDEGNLYANFLFNDLQSKLMKSTDNGDTWEVLLDTLGLRFNSYANNIRHEYEIIQDYIYVVGEQGRIFVVNTNGDLIETLSIPNSQITKLHAIDKNHLIASVQDQALSRLVRSNDGGQTWEMIYDNPGLPIGFDSPEKGLLILGSGPPSPISSDLVASTNDGGQTWIKAERESLNLLNTFAGSQKIENGRWLFIVNNELVEIKEE